MARLWRRHGSPFSTGSLGVPDTLEGRFTLCRCISSSCCTGSRAEGAEGAGIVQGLVDRFSQDMETVLRELGVSDMRIPKKMRALAASSMGLLQTYENACAKGESALAAAIDAALPDGTAEWESLAAVLSLPIYGQASAALEQQTFASLREGAIKFPEVSQTR